MNWFLFLLASLATFRMSLLISKEDGPAWIFRRLRRLPSKRSSVHEGIACEWCVSVWMSALVTSFLFWRGLIEGWDWPLWWLALSAAAIALNQTFTRG